MSQLRKSKRSPSTPGVAAPADRRFRRSDLLPDRRRRFARTLWGSTRWILAPALFLLLLVWGTQRLMASDLFLVKVIQLRGNSQLSAGDVEVLLEGLRGQNVFDVDLERYRQRMTDSSWVERAALSRVLPSTIVVDVIERTPMALARVGSRLYLVDRTGNIVDEHGPAYHEFDLPTVDGLLTAAKDGTPAADPDRVALAVALMTGLDGRADLGARLSQIDVSNPRDAVVMFDDDPAWLHLGDERFVDRLERYLELRPTFREKFGAVDYVDLQFDERVYVRGLGQRSARSVATK
jgi:cell division protein FtsQ